MVTLTRNLFVSFTDDGAEFLSCLNEVQEEPFTYQMSMRTRSLKN